MFPLKPDAEIDRRLHEWGFCEIKQYILSSLFLSNKYFISKGDKMAYIVSIFLKNYNPQKAWY